MEADIALHRANYHASMLFPNTRLAIRSKIVPKIHNLQFVNGHNRSIVFQEQRSNAMVG